MVILSARSISKSFSDTVALRETDLDLPEGEVLGIVGPNGAGKTTLLRILAGIEEPDTGTIYLDGELTDGGELRRHCTLAFQAPVMLSGSVLDNIAYGLRLRRLPRSEIKTRALAALKEVELVDKASRNAKTLSGGEQQRVSLARAFALDTEILLMDEPRSNLDPKSKFIIDRILRTVLSESKTVVIASHDIYHVGRTCSMLAFMDQGRIIARGKPDEILRRGLVQSFALTINVFSGESEPGPGGLSNVDLPNGVQIEALTQKKGPVVIRIRPEDITLSMEPVGTSARNCVKGPISSIVDEGPTALVGVDIGIEAYARISHASLKEMDLRLGQEICLLFKASAVEVI